MSLLLISSLFLSAFSFKLTDLKFLQCQLCKQTVSLARSVANNHQLQSIAIQIGEWVCRQYVKQQPAVCKGAVLEMANIVMDSLIAHYLDPQFVCFSFGTCTYPSFVRQNFTQWQSALLKTKPPSSPQVPTKKSSYYFSQMTDVHMDFFYSAGSNSDCGLPVCCRDWNGKGSAGYWGDYSCDIPVRTLQAGIQQLSALKPDFLLWTGDVPPHDVWNQSESLQVAYQNVSVNLLYKYFPNTPVYSIFGNHACYPVNVYDPEDAGWLLDPYAELFGYWLPQSAKETIRKMGTYSVSHDEKLRIIAINTQVCNNLNFYLFKNVTDPNGQIGWLIDELIAAEFKGQKVYIIGHIPMQSGDCLSAWAAHVNAIFDRFSGTILAQFYGHTHKDQFHISRGVLTGQPLSLQWVSPSMTTFTNKNPSFRLYEGDSDTKIVTDILQYRINLTAANINNDTKFNFAYSMKKEYGLEDLSPKSIENLVENLKGSEEIALKWDYNYETGGPEAKTSCDQSCRDGIYCSLAYGTAVEYEACRGSHPSGKDKILGELFGPWIYKVYQW